MIARRRAAALAALVVIVVALIAVLGSDDPDLDADAIAARAADLTQDPFAYEPRLEAEFESRAAQGSSHVIYEKSPGGVLASAARTARFRPRVERAADAHGVDPDLMEAMVLLESAGRDQVIAGRTPEAASGLAQILPSTATDLLGMEVDLARSRKLTRRIEASLLELPAKLIRRRARIDERFDADAALDGMGRYLEIAGEEFGRDDLAVASYHMGIGNLSDVIALYTGDEETAPADLVAGEELSYAQLFFDSSPLENENAWELLASLGDDSSTYYWRVLASLEVMRLWHEDRARLGELAELHGSASSAELVFHPEGEVPPEGELVALPPGEGYGYSLGAALEAEPPAVDDSALAALVFICGRVASLAGSGNLTVAAAGGYSFDIERDYESDRQAEMFQFVLDRLRALAVIDYGVTAETIHVAVSDLAEGLTGD